MSEDNDRIIDGEYTEKEYTGPVNDPRRPKKHHKGGTVAIAIACGLAAGFGGSAIGYAVFNGTGSGGTTVVYKDASSSDASTKNTSSTSQSGDLSTADIAAKASPSVVEINVTGTETYYGMFGGTYQTEAAGSGVIISADGYIITNNHVVEDGSDYKVVTSDGTEYTASLVATDSKSDIAVLKVDATDLTPATIGDSDKIQVGDKAVVIGNPLGTLGGTVTDGIISATNRQITINNESMNLIQTNAAINSGNSGGGLFDGQGNLIGIVNAKDSGTTSSGTTIEGLGFAIPINEAMDVAQQLMENGKVTDRASLGVYVQELQQDSGRYKAGVYITSLVDGGGAEAAGLKVYDRIVKVDDTDITSYTDLSAVLSSHKIGDKVSVTVERDGNEKTYDVTLGSSAAE
ncbi:MAG: trypsin-like peptidase domain-containing protein [Solobacterium sp.]|jgi:serine protease Do|nr:trypsin-like peptidase domain-containing protein [Solobacterium sp.]MCH4047969.1 trypsin-like peptidase domain-containing protein [Solobacterium sp.]MCH4075445.1 trypsin-like peptidase domain-containing protein [Solobacterium sp.]MCI1314563.1 trypsin-like peptidase domain-containing protein [Solobacterium sp.]MCI1346764.1 trypsin-like peptidase domain-containing protein [Solobacterium sp.]